MSTTTTTSSSNSASSASSTTTTNTKQLLVTYSWNYNYIIQCAYTKHRHTAIPRNSH